MLIYIPKQHSQAEVETYSSRANNLLTGQEEIGPESVSPTLATPPPCSCCFLEYKITEPPVSLILTAPYKTLQGLVM